MSGQAKAPIIRCLSIVLWLVLVGFSARGFASSEPPVTRIRGFVLDGDGKPLPGAAVGIQISRHLKDIRGQYPQFPLRAIADTQGRFELVIPQALGRVVVISHLEGWQVAESPLVALGAAQLELAPLHLHPGFILRGIVLDTQRRPVSGATIFTRNAKPFVADTILTTGRRLQTTSGPNGRFELAGFESTECEVRVELAGQTRWGSHHHDISAEPFEIVFEQLAAYVSGVVTDPAGRPLAGVTLSYNRTPSVFAMTNVDGRFRIGPFGSGQSFIDVKLPGYRPLVARIYAPNSEAKLVLLPNGTLRGRVLDAETRKPIESFKVAFRGRNQPAREYDVKPKPRQFTSDEGRFEYRDVYGGSWTVQTTAPGYVLSQMPIEIKSGADSTEVVIEMRRGSNLRGRVVDKTTGKPLVATEIFYLQGDYDTERVSTYSKLDGSFSLTELPNEPVELVVDAPGYARIQRKIDARQQPNVTFALGQGVTITGQVLESDGATPVQAQVELAVDDAVVVLHNTDAQGQFSIKHHRGGRYRLTAKTRAGRSTAKELVVAEDQSLNGVELVTEPLPVVRGRVTGLVGSDLQARIAVVTRLLEGCPRYIEYFDRPAQVQSQSNGAYLIEGVEPGPAWIVANLGNEEHSLAKYITIPAQGEVGVDFDFSSTPRISGRVTRDGAPAPDSYICALPLSGQKVSAAALTSATGEYTFTDLPDGEYRLQHGLLPAVRVTVGTAVTQNFKVPPFEISGEVTDLANSQADSFGRVELRDGAGELRGVALCDHRGRFKLDSLEAGDYMLKVLYEVGKPYEQRISITTSSVSGLQITLPRLEDMPAQR